MVIIFGASSFIGTYLVDELVKKGKKIIVLGRNIENLQYFRNLENVKAINFNIQNLKDFKKLPNNDIEAVVHLAGIMPANVKKDLYNPYDYIDVNIKGTLNILEYCKNNNVKKIIYTSSESDVAMHYNKNIVIDENTPRAINYNNDHTVYAITKIASMDLIEHYSQAYNIQGIYFRLQNIFGYGQLLEHYRNGEKVLNGFGTFLYKAIRGEDIEIWGNPNIGRDMLYIKDLISMITMAIESSNARGLYCAGTGEKISLLEQVKGIIEVFSMNKKSNIIFREEKPSVRSYTYDISKLKRDLNFEIEYSYKEWLKDWKKEFEENRFPHLENRANILKKDVY
jgi:UDP-glucose 4-epimerase